MARERVAPGRRSWVTVVKEEVRGSGQERWWSEGGIYRKWWPKGEVRGRRWGRNTQEAPSSPSGFPLARGLQAWKLPQGAGAGECGEGDSLALGLRPGSFDSSQN